ncbi:hypothetical protein D9M69_647100 [compost metagenome]
MLSTTAPIFRDSHQCRGHSRVLQSRISPALVAFGELALLPATFIDAPAIDATFVKAFDRKPAFDLFGRDHFDHLAHRGRRPEGNFGILRRLSQDAADALVSDVIKVFGGGQGSSLRYPFGQLSRVDLSFT